MAVSPTVNQVNSAKAIMPLSKDWEFLTLKALIP
jgi:hypothetical protein